MVRVRFAPSPTGNLHVGNGRTAVLNYLFARRERGQFILRIEDTDVERSQEVFEDAIREDLTWLSLDWDEGPFRQSDRLDIYRSHGRALMEKGLAYKCFCSKDELEKTRADALRQGRPPRYDGTCRNLTEDAAGRLEASGRSHVLRFRSLEREIAFKDGIHGEVLFPADHVDDFIIMRSDNIPSYNFAAAVDDLLMSITHVIRGADHLSNTPKQIMLFLAFGKEPPSYAHHSLLIGPDRKPLSKRHGATRVAEFRAIGVLPEAMVNYLGIIGRKVDREVLDQKGLAEAFSLESLSSSDGVFDLDKLLWLNKEHLRGLDTDVLLQRLALPQAERERVAVLRENVKTLNDIKPMLDMFVNPDIDESAFAHLLAMKDKAPLPVLPKELFEGNPTDFEQIFTDVEKESSLPKRELFLFLRIAITGRKSGPPLKALYPLIPRDILLKRIECLENRLSAPSRT